MATTKRRFSQWNHLGGTGDHSPDKDSYNDAMWHLVLNGKRPQKVGQIEIGRLGLHDLPLPAELAVALDLSFFSRPT